MEFRDIITAGILHEMSSSAKRKFKKAGKIAAAFGAAGAGTAYAIRNKENLSDFKDETIDKVKDALNLRKDEAVKDNTEDIINTYEEYKKADNLGNTKKTDELSTKIRELNKERILLNVDKLKEKMSNWYRD